MRVRAVIYVVAAVLVAAFFIANWSLVTSPVSLNVLFSRVETPLGVLLLLVAGLVLLLDLAIHTLTEHTWRGEKRQLAAEVERLRAARTQEEESRTQSLRAAMEREFAALHAKLERVGTGVQRLENDTMEAPPPAPPASAIEPELVPPRPAAGRSRQ